MEEIIGVLNDIVWSDALICFVFRDRALSIRTRFCRYVILRKCFVCCLIKVQNLEFLLSHYQCLAGRGWVGNIAGVATAIALEDRALF
jgi:AGCS family alanine or glycine:cation symporter